jgi:integrase
MLSRAFRQARDAAGVGAYLARHQRPSFHEIRALGGDLLLEGGWSKDAVRRLYGHTTEAMTDVYLDRRGREVRYTDAETG